MQFRLASENEFESVKAFYYKLIDDMEGSPYHPMWAKEVYPSDPMLKDALKNQELYLLEDEDAIIGAMIMNNECIDSYGSVPWQIDAPPEKVSIIHAFGVTPAMHGKGAATVMIENAFKLAQAKNQAAIRLDALAHNIPAQKFYSKSGFTHVQTLKMFYEDTGWKDFLAYEYLL